MPRLRRLRDCLLIWRRMMPPMRPGRCLRSMAARRREGWRVGETNMRLKDKVALITGGTSGIGEATALLFAREGARLAITGRNSDRGSQVMAWIKDGGSEGIFIRADVSLSSDCQRVIEETLRLFGPIDILFNNAGVFYA